MSASIHALFVELHTDHPNGASHILDVVAVVMEREFGRLRYTVSEITGKRVFTGTNTSPLEYSHTEPLSGAAAIIIHYTDGAETEVAEAARRALEQRFPPTER